MSHKTIFHWILHTRFSDNQRCYSLDPDQARQNVGRDLKPNCFTL